MSSIIARNLRYLRKNKKLSQEGLAKMVEMNRGNIASYEKGTAEPNVAKLIRKSQFFAVRLGDFIQKDLEELANKPKDHRPDFQTLEELQSRKSSAEIEAVLLSFERFERIYLGQLEMHHFQLAKYGEASSEMRRLINDHERLLEVCGEMVKAFKEITGQNLL
ncbi:MAG: helix-turn-helix transcriptional regulator, partial [Bacteroidota bacterium]